MAVIAFGLRFDVKVRFADGQHAVVAFAAIPEHLLMIDEGSFGESQRGMAGFAHIAGRVVVRDFW